MPSQHDFGKLGEEKAVEYLEKEGYVVLERNWRSGHKEVDIICTDGELIVVVEVKSRNSPEEYPGELLGIKKQHNLLYAAEAYLKYKRISKELRFDLVLVTGDRFEIEHIPDIFTVFD